MIQILKSYLFVIVPYQIGYYRSEEQAAAMYDLKAVCCVPANGLVHTI